MKKLQIIEQQGQRVLTTKQLAEAYGVDEKKIKQNFGYNRRRFIEGKHYIEVTGQCLREFKHKVENFDLVKKQANTLYLWTERGALLHAKSLNNDTAWQVYDWLVDFYFRVKESKPQPASQHCDIRGDADIQKQMSKIRELAVSVNGVLEVANRNMNKEEFPAHQEVIFSLCAELCHTAYKFKSVTPKMLPK